MENSLITNNKEAMVTLKLKILKINYKHSRVNDSNISLDITLVIK